MEDIHGIHKYLPDTDSVEIYQSYYQMNESVVQNTMIYEFYDSNNELIKQIRIIKHMNDGAYEYEHLAFVTNVNYIINNGYPTTFHQDDAVWGKKYTFTHNM